MTTFTNGTDTAYNASAYMVTGAEWASGTIEWANMPAANTLLQSNISHNNLTGYTFSCLTAVQSWYNGDLTGQHNNYGIMLRYYDETVADYNAVYSADYTDESKRPTLTITYDAPTSEINILEGYTRQLSVSGTTETVTWESGNTAIATVDANGIVTGVKAGKVTITASVGDIVYHAFTVYVKVADGVYRIDCASSNFYLGTYGSALENTPAHLFSVNESGLGMLRQLWRITYLGGGYYVVRPLYNMNMALHAKDGVVDITTVGDTNSLSAIHSENRWTIEFASSGYLFKCEGETGQTMRSNSVYPGARVMTAEHSSTIASFQWSFESVSSVTNQVLLLETQSGEPVANTTRYIAPGETATLSDFGITASFVCGYNTDQSITWSTLNPSVVSVNAETGSVTGLAVGKTATVVASHTYNGITHEQYYSVYVAQENVPVYCILHYYDMGYNVREGDAKTAIQSYHDAVAARFNSIFGLKLLVSINAYTSICDECAMDQSKEITSTSLETLCKHPTACATTASLRSDLFSRVSSGTDTTSVVIWSGRKMRDYQSDRSNADSNTHSVVMTTYGIDDWNSMHESYGEPFDTAAIFKTRAFTLMHELSHQLGAPDHYCAGASSDKGCDNDFCDTCYFGYYSPRACVMSREYDLSTLSDEEMYCADCEAVIQSHLADHH